MTIHLDIATMLPTDRQGQGTADFDPYDTWMVEFISGEPCADCVNAQTARDRHSICDLMIDRQTN